MAVSAAGVVHRGSREHQVSWLRSALQREEVKKRSRYEREAEGWMEEAEEEGIGGYEALEHADQK